MKKTIIFLVLSILFLFAFYGADCYHDKEVLQSNIIRLHIVANSDDVQDQEQKLRVRDTVNEYLSEILNGTASAEEAKDVIIDHLKEIEDTVSAFLLGEGTQMSVCATLKDEPFEIREYDSFTLPSGIYTALRIELGEGKGKNWWCVVYPSLCLPAAGKSIELTAAGAGFSDSLTDSLTDRYQFRFYILDLFGQAEKFFRKH